MIKQLTKSIILYIESEINESNIEFRFRKKCMIDENSNWLRFLSHQKPDFTRHTKRSPDQFCLLLVSEMYCNH